MLVVWCAALSTAKLPGQTDNLAELENLNEETLLEELKIRFKRDTIYTYVGEILVTVNPFKWIGVSDGVLFFLVCAGLNRSVRVVRAMMLDVSTMPPAHRAVS